MPVADLRDFSELGVAEILGMGEITHEGIERREKGWKYGDRGNTDACIRLVVKQSNRSYFLNQLAESSVLRVLITKSDSLPSHPESRPGALLE